MTAILVWARARASRFNFSKRSASVSTALVEVRISQGYAERFLMAVSM